MHIRKPLGTWAGITHLIGVQQMSCDDPICRVPADADTDDGDSKTDTDDGDIYRYWFVATCPFSYECSAMSWKRASCWSWDGPTEVCEKVLEHFLHRWDVVMLSLRY